MTAFRLSLFYASFFAVTGVQLPFWPVWLDSRGLDASTIGVVMALSFGAKAVSTPLVAHFADRSGERRRLIIVFTLFAFGGFSLFHWSDSIWLLVALSLLFFSVWPPVMSLTETITMHFDRLGVVDYGRIRLWGSLSFIVLATGSGWILVDAPPETIFWLVLAALAVTSFAVFALPDARGEKHAESQAPVVAALRSKRLLLALIACGLIQGSHAVYYGFATLHWKSLGHASDVIGLLWAEGVFAEIVLFALGGRLLRTTNPVGLIILAAAACMVRWTGTAFASELPALIVLQALHAFSFGAAHLGAMHFIGREVPQAQSATAQSLYSSLVWGVSLGVALYGAGLLYDAFSGAAFLAMAGIGGCGLIAGCVLARTPG